MATRKTDWAVGAHSTSTMRSGWVWRFSTFAQSARCTETPAPRVTQPMISSPGTGVQQRASFDSTSVAPLTMTPASPRAVRLRRSRVAGSRTPSAELLSRALLAAVRLDQTPYDGLCGDVALADGGIQAGDVRGSAASSRPR